MSYSTSYTSFKSFKSQKASKVFGRAALRAPRPRSHGTAAAAAARGLQKAEASGPQAGSAQRPRRNAMDFRHEFEDDFEDESHEIHMKINENQ